MKVLLQRVTEAKVEVNDQVIGEIDAGYLLFLGVFEGDTEEQAAWLAEKIAKLRLFQGPDGKLNDQSILDTEGEVLIVSQFTLAGSVAKGSRPDFGQAAAPEHANALYEYFIAQMKAQQIRKVETGEFGAMMSVSLINDGPMTLLLER